MNEFLEIVSPILRTAGMFVQFGALIYVALCLVLSEDKIRRPNQIGMLFLMLLALTGSLQ